MFLSTLSFSVILFLAGQALAVPTTNVLTSSTFRLTGCSVAKDAMNLPSNQTTLVTPTGSTPQHIGLGVGIQNYTCSAAGTFTSIGAVAELVDISCIHSSPFFSAIKSEVFTLWNSSSFLTTTDLMKALGASPAVLGQHVFVTNPITGIGISPSFDFRAASQKGNPNGFVTCAKTGDLPSPTGSKDVDWLFLTPIQGGLAKDVFRIDTKAGQPPSSCTPGAAISIKYIAEYWFF